MASGHWIVFSSVLQQMGVSSGPTKPVAPMYFCNSCLASLAASRGVSPGERSALRTIFANSRRLALVGSCAVLGVKPFLHVLHSFPQFRVFTRRESTKRICVGLSHAGHVEMRKSVICQQVPPYLIVWIGVFQRSLSVLCVDSVQVGLDGFHLRVNILVRLTGLGHPCLNTWESGGHEKAKGNNNEELEVHLSVEDKKQINPKGIRQRGIPQGSQACST